MALNPRGFDQRRAPQPEDIRAPRVAERDAPLIDGDGINLRPRPEAPIARAPGAGPQAPAGQPGAAGQDPDAPRMPGQQANGQQTRAAAFGMAAAAPPEAAGIAQILGAAAGPDIIDDAEARRRAGLDQDGRLGHGFAVGRPEEVRNPDNLPMVLQRAILDPNRGGDPQAVVPQWHQVRLLPGYLQSMVRSIGRQAFAPFTDTPIEQISVLAHLEAGAQAARFGAPGNGPNQIAEINAMAGWIQRNGVRDDAATLDFTQNNPLMARYRGGYRPDIQIWNTAGYTFMLVNETADAAPVRGRYIYGWPGGRGVQLRNDRGPQAALPAAAANRPGLAVRALPPPRPEPAPQANPVRPAPAQPVIIDAPMPAEPADLPPFAAQVASWVLPSGDALVGVATSPFQVRLHTVGAHNAVAFLEVCGHARLHRRLGELQARMGAPALSAQAEAAHDALLADLKAALGRDDLTLDGRLLRSANANDTSAFKLPPLQPASPGAPAAKAAPASAATPTGQADLGLATPERALKAPAATASRPAADRKAAPVEASQASAPATPMAALRAAGFSVRTAPDGMVLRRERDDGVTVEVRGPKGVPFNKAASFVVVVGDEQRDGLSIEDVLEVMEARPAMTP